MLQPHRSLKQWRLGLRVKDLALYSSNGPSVIQPNHPKIFHQNLDRLSNCRFVCNNSVKLLEMGHEVTMKMLVRYQSTSGQGNNIFTRILKNFRDEMAKSKEMKESLKKFREEAEKLEQSDALKKARAKYMTLENEASVLKAKIDKVKGTVSGVIEEASKTEIVKKAGKISEELGKSARDAAESISAKGQQLGSTKAFKTISDATTAVREEIETSTSHNRVYVSPTKLRKRTETLDGEVREYAPDSTTVDVELHKDSRLYESWESFKNNNPYINKILDWKMKYEESDNVLFRMSRKLTDKVSGAFSGLFSNTELSSTLTEIVKVDPTFSKVRFLRDCETDIIPNILEAMTRGDLEILRDWCHEAPYNLLSNPIRQIQQFGGRSESKILDIDNLDLAMGKIMEPGPVLIITFTAQQILCFRDKNNKIIEGDPEKVLRINYVWALARDRNVLDPKAAWKLLDISANSVEQLV